MKIRLSIYLVVVLSAMMALGQQNWQDCKSDGSYSFSDVKNAVHRVTSTQGISGWDTKIFNRSGDMVAVAILQTLTEHKEDSDV